MKEKGGKKRFTNPIVVLAFNQVLVQPWATPSSCWLLQAHKDLQMASLTGPQAAEAAVPVFFPSLGQEITQSPGTEKADAENIPKDFLSSLCCVLGVTKEPALSPACSCTTKCRFWREAELSAPSDSSAHLPRDRDERKRDSHFPDFQSSLNCSNARATETTTLEHGNNRTAFAVNKQIKKKTFKKQQQTSPRLLAIQVISKAKFLFLNTRLTLLELLFGLQSCSERG